MKKTLFAKALSVEHGILESRLIARSDDLNRDLFWDETKAECQYILDTIDYAGHSREYVARVKRACRYVLRQKA